MRNPYPAGTILQAQGHKAKRNDWQTPEHVLERIRLLAPSNDISFDPASDWYNPTAAMRFCSPRAPSTGPARGSWVGPDGLAEEWKELARGGLVFLNQPYGSGAGGGAWLAKTAEEARRKVFIASLLGVARTEQPYFADTVLAEAQAACFVRGRIAFRNPDTGDLVSGGCYASWILGFNVRSMRRWKRALGPLCGSRTMQERGTEHSICVELKVL